ncbi:hypothetical protein CYMTET_38277 [Cymbomonas tetramitiformis]|uniref:Uncharacterized protein n=1 Tax=Cymbomonas tetramitiformis TaxID=36881 RepID=A0AAE0CE29_9CHLO|nr:hypothetical protein CYMTET_38277 [Cymbomonas tetramitiformis]
MESFRKFVEKTYFYGSAPVEGASEEEVTAYKAHCASQLAKRSAAEILLLQFKMKHGVFARDTEWEVAKTVSAADFWCLYRGAVKELQLSAMRTSAQVSGAGAADDERGHKVIAWTEGHEDNEAWQDARQAEDDAQQQARAAASESRASNTARASQVNDI